VNVIAKANALGESLHRAREVLTQSQRGLDDELKSLTQRVNILTVEVAMLNREIRYSEGGGVLANDFRDQRQTRLQELVRLTGASVREQADGYISVVVNGLLLVSDTRAAKLDSSVIGTSGLRQITFESASGLKFGIEEMLDAGEIGSVLDLRSRRLPEVISYLDQLAFTMVETFNAQHRLGFDLTGLAGSDFFSPMPSADGAAAQVKVEAALSSDPRRIAAAAVSNAVPGDNRNARAMMSLESTTHSVLGNLSFQDSFRSFVANVGFESAAARSALELREGLMEQTQAQREGVSGVNVDEEMTKIIMFQRAFDAASLLVRTTDSMYEQLIEMSRP
jgi:flagellar hook-associated protein 1 FlgK